MPRWSPASRRGTAGPESPARRLLIGVSRTRRAASSHRPPTERAVGRQDGRCRPCVAPAGVRIGRGRAEGRERHRERLRRRRSPLGHDVLLAGVQRVVGAHVEPRRRGAPHALVARAAARLGAGAAPRALRQERKVYDALHARQRQPAEAVRAREQRAGRQGAARLEQRRRLLRAQRRSALAAARPRGGGGAAADRGLASSVVLAVRRAAQCGARPAEEAPSWAPVQHAAAPAGC